MSERRQQLVREAFHYLDANGNGTLQLDEIKASFNVRAHPEVVQGIRSAESVLSEFYETFQVLHQMIHQAPDDSVSQEVFMDYYTNVSFLYERDDEFASLLRLSWDLPAKLKLSQTKMEKTAETNGNSALYKAWPSQQKEERQS